MADLPSAPQPPDQTSDQLPENPNLWSPLRRLIFRLVFCYCMLYALCCGNATIWELIPFHVGEHLSDWTNWPFSHAAEWLAQHSFHVQGVGAKLHETGSGDTAIAWIELGVFAVTAIVASLIWTGLDRKRTHYRKLFGWMRFILRISLGYAMLSYGLVKVFPLQMPPPSLAVLNEPLGSTSPMTLLWTLIGLNPVYEMVCGLAEVAAGVLILFRRTALAGALLTAFVVSNVVLYNFFFDVPVKIFASHLLLLAIVVIAPDVPALLRFFFLHKPAVPTGSWMLPEKKRVLRIETCVIVVVLLLTSGMNGYEFTKSIQRSREGLVHPSPFAGIWRLDAATLNGQPKPYLTGDGLPMTALSLEPTGRVMARASDNALWRGGWKLDTKKHALFVYSVGHGGVDYSYAQSDANHLVLTPTGDDARKESVLNLTRVPLPASYPLETRGFHLINEWGLER